MRKFYVVFIFLSFFAISGFVVSRPYSDQAVKNYLQSTGDTIGNPSAQLSGDGSAITNVTASDSYLPEDPANSNIDLDNNDLIGANKLELNNGASITENGNHFSVDDSIYLNGKSISAVDIINTTNIGAYAGLTIFFDDKIDMESNSITSADTISGNQIQSDQQKLTDTNSDGTQWILKESSQGDLVAEKSDTGDTTLVASD